MLRKPEIKTNKRGEKFVLFFRESEVNGVCSNWYMSDFTVDNRKFCCVEQYMMYMKAVIFKDTATAQKIMLTNSPRTMKALGRSVKNYCEGTWVANRYNVVYRAVLSKFEQNKELYDWIMAADADYFVECSPYDNIWGIKMSANDKRCTSVESWGGQNLLGKVLKDVRNTLIKKEVKQGCQIK